MTTSSAMRSDTGRTTAAPTQPVFLWATPRSVSTAFERVMKNSDELAIMHEPYTDSYYFGPGRRSSRYGERLTPLTEEEAEAIEAKILAGNDGRRIFVKELAFQGEPYVSDALLEAGRNVVITRHPQAVYASLSRLKPDFTEDEFGFTALSRICRRICALTDPPFVIDGDEFRAQAEAIASAVCAHIRINYSPELLVWKDGNIREWQQWEAQSQKVWHRTLEHSTTILKPTGLPEVDIKSDHAGWFARAMHVYRCLVDSRFADLP